MQTLTQRQSQALAVHRSGGKIDQGMIAALTKKGYLGGECEPVAKAPLAVLEARVIKKSQSGLPDYASRRWGSLCDLRDAIQRDQTEQVVSFDGITLRTDRRQFTLFDQALIERSL